MGLADPLLGLAFISKACEWPLPCTSRSAFHPPARSNTIHRAMKQKSIPRPVPKDKELKK
jgi:hypothetical protein